MDLSLSFSLNQTEISLYEDTSLIIMAPAADSQKSYGLIEMATVLDGVDFCQLRTRRQFFCSELLIAQILTVLAVGRPTLEQHSKEGYRPYIASIAAHMPINRYGSRSMPVALAATK